MTRTFRRLAPALAALLLSSSALTAPALATPPPEPIGIGAPAAPVDPAAKKKPANLQIARDEINPAYERIANDVASLISNPKVTGYLARRKLQMLNVLWEDTGRYQGSAVGPNISDVTIEVRTGLQGGRTRGVLMPVIRYPNFTDKTADVKMDAVRLRVGNHKEGGKLETITLTELLRDPSRYLSKPQHGAIKGGSLLAPARDSHALVSAQATFLPVPRKGQATFWPVIFNYQSYEGNPAVLSILATRQGTSIAVIENSADSQTSASWGQRLFFNKEGERAPLTAERLKDVKAKGVTANGESAASLGADANLLMLIQVPLKVAPRHRGDYDGMLEGAMPAAPSAAPAPSGGAPAARGRAGMDTAVLGHGKTDGPFTELDGLTIERDPRFPVRVTIQFYQATDDNKISEQEMDALAAQIDKIYDGGDYVGSLVVPEPGAPARPTEWDGIGPAPANLSIHDFPGLARRWGWQWGLGWVVSR